MAQENGMVQFEHPYTEICYGSGLFARIAGKKNSRGLDFGVEGSSVKR